MTPGTDGKTITELATLSDEQLISSMQHKLDWYVPQGVRRVEIPKGNDPTKKRPLGIPVFCDMAKETVFDFMILGCSRRIMDYFLSRPTAYHQRRMLSTENKPVSAFAPRFTNAVLSFKTYTP